MAHLNRNIKIKLKKILAFKFFLCDTVGKLSIITKMKISGKTGSKILCQ